MIVKSITARPIIASLGDQTLEVQLVTEKGAFTASVPAGLSAGKYEVVKAPIPEALSQIEKISADCLGREAKQEIIDEYLDQKLTEGFGGNTTLAVSAAIFKSNVTFTRGEKIPRMMLLIFEGGEHGNKNITAQEFMVVEDTVNQAAEDFARVKHFLKEHGIETTVGAEGGFSPNDFDNLKCLDIIKNVLPERLISIDVADCFQSADPLDYEQICEKYNLFSIEDPFNDEDWENWKKVNTNPKVRGKAIIIGDDLTVTNTTRIQQAIEMKAVSGVVIKPNQIGTISAALQAVELCKSHGLSVVVSHRGQETNDSWIADFAVYCGADFVKLGGMDRGERVAKYNRLIEIASL